MIAYKVSRHFICDTRRCLSRGFAAIASRNVRPLNLHVTQNGTDGSPVALLLGWVGCQDKHLQKYAKIYEDRGIATVRYTAPFHVLFFRRGKMSQVAESILRTLEEEKLDKRPLVVHVFSNGGAYCFKYISDEIRKSQRDLKIKGQIFDSAPCSTSHLPTFYHVVKEVVGKDKFYAPVVAAGSILGLTVMRLLYLPLRNYLPDKDPYQKLISDERNFPQMLLYSKEDQLMPFKDVEKFGKCRKDRGVDMTVYRFEGSGHVNHYVMFKETYLKLLDEFLRKCGAVK